MSRIQHDNFEIKLKKALITSKNSILLLGIMLLLLASRLILTFFNDSDITYSVAAACLQLFCFIVPSFVFLYIRNISSSEMIDIHLNMPRLISTPVIISSFFLLISGAILIVLKSGNAEDYNFSLYNTFDAAASYGFMDILMLTVSCALIPAVCEEFVFRGIFASVFGRQGVMCSALLCTLYFSLAHMNVAGFFVFMYAGFILWLLLSATGSLYVPMAIHFIYNLFCMFGLPYINSFYGDTMSHELFIFIITATFLLSASIFCAGMAWIYKKNSESGKNSMYSHSAGIKASATFIGKELISISTLICIIIYIIIYLIKAFAN